MKPLISVVTPSYNYANTLTRALHSVISQDYENIEHIVVDGGSSDGSIDIIKKYSDKISCWITENDEGMYDAINKGIRLTSGGYIILLNADDYFCSNTVISEIVPLLKIDYVNSCSVLLESQLISGIPNPGSLLHRLKCLYKCPLPHPGFILSKRLYNEIGLYDCSFKMAADYGLIYKAINRYPINFIDKTITIMPKAGMSARFRKKGYAEFRDIAIKNGRSKILSYFFYFLQLINVSIRLRIK